MHRGLDLKDADQIRCLASSTWLVPLEPASTSSSEGPSRGDGDPRIVSIALLRIASRPRLAGHHPGSPTSGSPGSPATSPERNPADPPPEAAERQARYGSHHRSPRRGCSMHTRWRRTEDPLVPKPKDAFPIFLEHRIANDPATMATSFGWYSGARARCSRINGLVTPRSALRLDGDPGDSGKKRSYPLDVCLEPEARARWNKLASAAFASTPRSYPRGATIAGQGTPQKKPRETESITPARKKLHGVLQTVASTFTSLSMASIRRLPKE